MRSHLNAWLHNEIVSTIQSVRLHCSFVIDNQREANAVLDSTKRFYVLTQRSGPSRLVLVINSSATAFVGDCL